MKLIVQAPLLAGLACSSMVWSAELDELQRELDATRAQLDALQTRVTESGAASESRHKNFVVYGFAQLDMIQDFERVNPNWEATLRPSRIPTQDGQYGSDGQTIASVRQSRLGVEANLPVGEDTIHTVFEFDLYGVGADEGQTTMRVRHAYGEWKSILAGQTNSLFMDGNVFPNVIDYWGPAGMVFLRNPQIRWTPIKGTNTFAVAIESPGNDVDNGMLGVDGFDISGDQPLPDVTMHYRNTGHWGHVQVAGILRDVAYESVQADNNEPSGNDIGWGLNVTGTLAFGDDTLRLGTVYGEGIASYMNDGGMDMAPEGPNADSLSSVPLLGMIAYYDHQWSERYSTSFGYSFTEVDNQAYQLPDAFKKGEYLSANLLYTPRKNLLMGVEYLWGQRTDFGGASGTDNRVQLSLKYTFSTQDF
ncbi:DcaP family trimeric outer membrane transporter [Gilvimarinus agarilyticus]|uniref:DcaP family trimeric outer membrane transporter n=1 Tax=Gilvimarinus agarilyticus TaxID=679259 RepID=UPI0005A1C6F3|nr:DcaP family trimeric outer membrane transporter [Gilvimarinus agarilyticus]